ncbi:hypothetical protein MKX03_035137 [Papaver bracteatum]|nr:hypothetical protein MKX03_035137 [Papaver bracteatum]
MDKKSEEILSSRPKWRKVAFGGMQPGYDDNYTDESFLEVCVWTYTLESNISEASLLILDVGLLGSGFLVLLLTAKKTRHSPSLGLYILAPIYHTLTRSISSDSIWALTASLLVLHLFLHDYAGSTIRPPGALTNPTLTSNISLNASIVASVLIASRLPSRLQVFAIVLFSLQVFLFAPLITYCIKKYSFVLHLLFSFGLMVVTLGFVFTLHRLLFVLLLSLLVFVTIICPYWLIKIQEYKFEIHGPWDEAKL